MPRTHWGRHWKRYAEMRELPPKGEPGQAESAAATGMCSACSFCADADADLSLSRFVPKQSEGIMLDTLHALRRSLEPSCACRPRSARRRSASVA